MTGRAAWLVAVCTLAPAFAAHRAPAMPRHQERTTLDSVYTLEQAERGQAAYARECARCHAATLEGADAAPALVGSAFTSAWSGQPLAALHERIVTAMPTDTPGVYGKAMVTDVIAFLLKTNGLPPGAAPLTHEQQALQAIRFVTARP